jgi:hypothetical protein
MNVEIGTVTRNSFSGNICFQFSGIDSLQCCLSLSSGMQ